ncbi:MAG TPA: LuxR C-terminal-related transcriptional regulator [Kofleriaceae bacterium]|nr:LuxR C-terminal-related transcriptional regulator [Kofleriaceae bacterium]
MGARRPDPLRLVEAAYCWEPDEQRWLDGVAEAAGGYDVGGGALAFTVHVGERTHVQHVGDNGATTSDREAVQRATESFPPALARHVYAPTEFVGNCAHRLLRLARMFDGSALAQAAAAGSRAIPPLWAIIAGNPARRSLMLCFPRGRQPTDSPHDPFPHADARSLGLVGAHLGAALRLRGAVRPSADDGTTEAVLTSNGKLLHATGAAATEQARTSLIDAVVSSERARGRMRRDSPEEAMLAWTSLVQGRWTIIDSIERDGKRLLLARRNPVHSVGLLDLTPDERDVAWLAALGHSYKYIAYELGHPLSTVASRLRRAMRKLRVRSRTELLQKLGTAAVDGV